MAEAIASKSVGFKASEGPSKKNPRLPKKHFSGCLSVWAPQLTVSVSAAGISLYKVLTRKTTKIHSFCFQIHAFTEVFEERLEFPEQEKNMRKFVPAQELCYDHKNGF